MADRRFFVTLAAAVDDFRDDDHLLIDPGMRPSPGDYVLVPGRIERFRGQTDIRGVVVAIAREVPHGGREVRYDRTH
ncbi:hypothetical protein ABZN20_12530 [Methylococcus sp. ANG]|uniref:hypothetical protein n=1 Tax=Methylococcus sp. ANG TaxID=3231903 RepID=UPI003459C186